MMKKMSPRFWMSSAGIHPCLGMFIIRLALASVFIGAGWMKLTHIDMVAGFFSQIQLGIFWVWLVALVEFIGGIALLFGMFTRLASALLAIIMLVVVFKVKWASGWAGMQGDVMILAMTLAVFFIGSRTWSLCKTAKCDNSMCTTGMCSGCNKNMKDCSCN